MEIQCPTCFTQDWSLIRTETTTTTRYLEKGKLSGWITSDEPEYADETWYCSAGHPAPFDLVDRLYDTEDAVDSET